MVSDPMFYVRKEVAAAVGSLSAAVTPEITLEKLVKKKKAFLSFYRKIMILILYIHYLFFFISYLFIQNFQ